MNIYNQEIYIINPPHIFGDGKHETTQHLLYFLNKYNSKYQSYIDIGSGTGILSIFASKKGLKVIAIDCDEYAINCTIDNAKRNNVQFKTLINDVARINNITGDIVTGNFGQTMAIYYLPILSRFVKPKGILITTWYKQLDKKPIDELNNWKIIDYREGIEYDAYVLQKQ